MSEQGIDRPELRAERLLTRVVMTLGVLWAITLLLAPAAAAAGACETSARTMRFACSNDVKDDYWEGVSICLNESDAEEQEECLDDVVADREEGNEECHDVHDARRDLCEELEEDTYDPNFDPEDFEEEFGPLGGAVINQYLPIVVGNTWEYEGDGEEINIEVEDATKLIEGVTCVVVNDVVTEDGLLIEDTDDWFAQATNGDIWYCGEEAKDYEYFEGDDPEEPELVEIDGSFKHGREGAKAGILILDNPAEGDIYRQEWALGDAEDVAEVISIDYSFGDDEELDELVPEELAELLCDDDCLVTREFNPLEPDSEEYKYYAPGIGVFLEVNREDEEIVQLVGCNVDPICDSLPEPEE